MAGAFSTAIISSRVPCSRATASQSVSESGCPGGRWPEITVKSCATPRWVTGMPARAGTAIGLVSPGTTVTGTPAARQASTSSKPRPKTKLSPPLNRTTRFPARARSTMIRLISSCWAARPRGSFATSISSTSAGSSPSSSRGASRSATTTSASISALRPATEISSGSPGPPPTSTTPGDAVPLVAGDDGALAQPLEDLVAHRGAAPRLPVAEHRDGDARVPPDRRGPGAGPGRVVRRGRRRCGAVRHPRSPPR